MIIMALVATAGDMGELATCPYMQDTVVLNQEDSDRVAVSFFVFFFSFSFS